MDRLLWLADSRMLWCWLTRLLHYNEGHMGDRQVPLALLCKHRSLRRSPRPWHLAVPWIQFAVIPTIILSLFTGKQRVNGSKWLTVCCWRIQCVKHPPPLLKMNIVKTSTNAPVREDELYEKWMSQQSLQSSSHPALKQKTHLASFWVLPFFI